ncbi:hypothetical protein HDU67_006036 [Dinochytrium kinnereticum]|nr:hypothetical protein HDU67_006036 [Dinochytrium kinnereticum]
MAQSDEDGFDPSVLGTKEHWDDVYKREVKNFDENGDIGEIWFGEESVEKMMDWILENVPDKKTKTIDLGCGNGHMLLEMVFPPDAWKGRLTVYDKASLDYTSLVGVDYSQHSVDLAVKVADEQRRDFIVYKQADILSPNPSLGKFGLALDKGTLDAISLAENVTNGKDRYSKAVADLLEDSGTLLITSCNWTEEELVAILKNDFTMFGRVKYPTFKFGGVEGQKIVTVAFRKNTTLYHMDIEEVPTVDKMNVDPVEMIASDSIVDTSAKVAPAAGHLDEEEDVDMEAVEDAELDAERDQKPSKIRDLTKDGGVLKKILRRGEEYGDRPEKDDEVQVNYIGRLVQEGKEEGQGDEFDRNQDRQNPFTFILGKGQVIKGWDRAVKSMKKGELARVTIKSEYGYGESGAGAKIPPNATLEFDIELLGWRNVNALTSDGLVTIKMLKESEAGWQTPKDGWEVQVNYIAKADGVEFERIDAFTFTVGTADDTVPPFFSDAIKKFKKTSSSKSGDVGLLTIPAKHFTLPHPKVPEGATVTYEITVNTWIEVEELDGGGAFKRLLRDAESGWEKPTEGASVRLRLLGRTKATNYVFLKDEEERVVKVGDNSLPEAVEAALLTMRVGEKVSVTTNADWGYGTLLTKEYGLEEVGKEGYYFEIDLIGIEAKPKESYELSKDEKMVESEKFREIGNAYFKDNKPRGAAKKYEKALKNFQYDNNLSADEKKRLNAIKLPCHLNLAACYLKTKQFDKTIEECNKAIAISSHSPKAFYRRAQARLHRIELDEALSDIQKAIDYDAEQGGNDAGLKVFLKQVNLEIRKYDKKDKKLYQKMFR